MPAEDSKNVRWQRCVTALVSLIRKEGVDDIERVDAAIRMLRPRLAAYFARAKLKKRSRGIISILGVKRRAGNDMFDPYLDEERRELPETEEQHKESEMIERLQRFQTMWSCWRFVIQLYIFVAVLFRICFEIPRDAVSWTFEFLFVDVTSFLTIAYRFFAYKDDRGIPRWNPQEQRVEYLKSWFAVDLLGALPFDFIGMAISADWAKCTIRFNRCGFIAPYWQLNRLLNCRGMFEVFNDVLEALLLRFSIHPYVARVVMSFLNFLAIAHGFACGLYVLFVIYYEDFETVRAGGEPLDTVSMVFQYAVCLEWAGKNLVGLNAGFAFPNNWVQLVYNVFTSFVGVSVFGVMLATIANYVSRPSPEADFQQDMDSIIDIMEYKKFPEEIRDDVLSFMRHRYDARTHMLRHDEALDGLPDELLDLILLKEGMDLLSRVSLFQPHLGNKRFVVSLARMLQPDILPPGFVVFEKGDVGDAMYFVVQGALGVVNGDNHDEVWFRINPGAFVGEIALLMDGPRTATVVVVSDTFCDLMTLHKDDFQRLSGQFPQLFRHMQVAARDRFLELNKDLFENARKLGDVVYQRHDLQDAVEEVLEDVPEINTNPRPAGHMLVPPGGDTPSKRRKRRPSVLESIQKLRESEERAKDAQQGRAHSPAGVSSAGGSHN